MKKHYFSDLRTCLYVILVLTGSLGIPLNTYCQTSKEYTDADVDGFVADLEAGVCDTFILSTSGGIYDVNSATIPKTAVIMGKEGLTDKPVLKNTANTSGSYGIFRGRNSSVANRIIFYNLEFDGRGAPSAPLLIRTEDTTKIIVKDCYIHDFTNGNGLFRMNGAGSSFEMYNTIIVNAKRRIIHCYSGGLPYGDIHVKNTTFAGSSEGGVVYFRSSGGVYAAGNNVNIDHCTFYNISGDITRYKADSIHGIISVTNSVFEQVTGGVDADVVDYNYVSGLGTAPDNATNSILTAPDFADPANLNFTLINKEVLTGNDFLTLGDLSWYTDDIPPVVFEKLIKEDQTHVLIRFNEGIEPVSAVDVNNYLLSGTAGLTGKPAEAVLMENGKDVLLTVPDLSGMTIGETVIVTVSNIKDLLGNVIGENNTASYALLDETAPFISMSEQTVTNDPGQVAMAQSNELGKIYLILQGISQGTVEELNEAVENRKGLMEVVETADSDVTISVEAAEAGVYFAYAVDEYNNVSLKSESAVTISDITAPEITLDVQEVSNSSLDEVIAVSNERGMIYFILEGETHSTVDDLEAAVFANKGFSTPVLSADAEVSLSPNGAEPGNYYGYAVDNAGNISAPGDVVVKVYKYEPRVRYYEASEAETMAKDLVSALDGDIFILTTSGGEYNLQYWTKISAKITIMADEDLTEPPVLTNFKESNTTQIMRLNADGSGIYAKGIIFDSKSREPGNYPLKYGIRTNPDIGNYSLVLEDCQFRGIYQANDGSPGAILRLYNGTFADSIIIKNCLFEGDEAIVLNSSGGPFTWGKFEITNSTFMNMPDDQAIQIVQKGEHKTLPVTIDHCTFYNTGGLNEEIIRIDSLFSVNLTNSVFGGSSADTSFHIYGDEQNQGLADYLNFFGSPVALADKGGILGTSIWTEDPVFADPEKGDLTLGNESFFTKGSDGLPLGDLRWADIFGPKVKALVTSRSDSTLVLKFDEWIDTTTASLATNYELSGSAGFTGNVKKAELYNFHSVLLTLDSFADQAGNEIIIRVSNVTDLKNNPVSAPDNIAVYTVEEFLPVVAAESQNLTNGEGQMVIAQSNQGSGYVYLILEGEPHSNTGELDAAVEALKGAKVEVTAAYTDMALDVYRLDPGTYFLYAVDDAGNISERGENAILITDGIPPLISLQIQSAENGTDDYVVAQSNEPGKIYIVLDSEPQENVNDFISARFAGKGADAVVGNVNTDISISTNGLIPGIYYAYAVDNNGNISDRGGFPLNIIQATTGIEKYSRIPVRIYTSNQRIIIESEQQTTYTGILITDLWGRGIMMETIVSDYAEYPIPRAGIYFVKLYNKEGKTYTRKLVVQ